MRIGIVGGGILGLTLAYRLGRLGHRVEVFEAGPALGGLAGSFDYGEFHWDRFYHCILPQDTNLISLLGELGLSGDLRWKQTGTGYHAGGRFHPMSGTRDFLRFPLLSLFQKARLGGAIVWASRFADPEKLWGITAKAWLERLCGERTYEVFWSPLLKAKLGVYHDDVAAVFLWATIARLFGARSQGAQREKLGYVRGGYRRILGRLREAIEEGGATVHVGSPVEDIRLARGEGGLPGCEIAVRGGAGDRRLEAFDQVLFTAPPRLARRVLSGELLEGVERLERAYPTTSRYLGVICLALVLEKPLTPFYVLNIGEERVELTGLVEITNLIDPVEETRGRALVYLPRYLDSEDPAFEETDDALRAAFVERGLRRLFPDLDESAIVSSHVHRARYVQPLPIAGSAPPAGADRVAALETPFQMIGTFMLRCATLNNNEVIGLVDRFVEANRARLGGG